MRPDNKIRNYLFSKKENEASSRSRWNTSVMMDKLAKRDNFSMRFVPAKRDNVFIAVHIAGIGVGCAWNIAQHWDHRQMCGTHQKAAAISIGIGTDDNNLFCGL
eukprot:scaffold1176_cov111-Cylindrotheca_fusiformis.AAC.2